jgi:hypothetical protein
MLHNLGTKTTLLSLLPNDVVASNDTGDAVDLAGYEGDMVVILDAEAGGSDQDDITYAVKLTEADTSGGQYTDVAGGAFTTTGEDEALVEKISVNTNDMKRFIKVDVTVTGGTGTGAVSVTALASKKYGN